MPESKPHSERGIVALRDIADMLRKNGLLGRTGEALDKIADDLEEQLETLRWHAQYVADMHPEGEEGVDHKSMRRLRNTLASFPATDEDRLIEALDDLDKSPPSDSFPASEPESA